MKSSLQKPPSSAPAVSVLPWGVRVWVYEALQVSTDVLNAYQDPSRPPNNQTHLIDPLLAGEIVIDQLLAVVDEEAAISARLNFDLFSVLLCWQTKAKDGHFLHECLEGWIPQKEWDVLAHVEHVGQFSSVFVKMRILAERGEEPAPSRWSQWWFNLRRKFSSWHWLT